MTLFGNFNVRRVTPTCVIGNALLFLSFSRVEIGQSSVVSPLHSEDTNYL